MVENQSEEKIYFFDENDHEKVIEKVVKNRDKIVFRKVNISYIAAMKMLDHAIRGKNFEIIGYLIGHVCDDIMYVLDTFEIPIKGTDSRVEVAAGLEGAKIMEMTVANYEMNAKIGKTHPYIGWYHSHPGFGCWLSEIDVRTQRDLQMVNKTWLAIVVDPYKSIKDNMIDLGCFMLGTPEADMEVKPNLPTEWAKSFGNTEKKYYQLTHKYFCSGKEKEVFDLMAKNNWSEDLCVNMVKRVLW